MDKIKRVALVGCGVISENHLCALEKLDSVKVVALCDVDKNRAEAKKKSHALNCNIYTDYEKMLSRESLDAVHIATPHYLHAKMAISALERNIYVFLEKPVCINEEEIKLLLEAEKRSKASVTVCFQNRFNHTFIRAMEIAKEDGVESGYFTLLWERDDKYYTESGWRGRYATEGGGVMINQAIHSLDQLIQLLGRPIAVTATKANHKHKSVIEVEDTSEGMIEFEGGIVGNFFATTAFTRSSKNTVFIKTKNRKLEFWTSKLYVDDKLEIDTKSKSYIGKEVYGDGHETLIKKFYEAIDEGAEMPVTLESAAWALRVLLAAYRSNDERAEI